jgi:hypothetical protein
MPEIDRPSIAQVCASFVTLPAIVASIASRTRRAGDRVSPAASGSGRTSKVPEAIVARVSRTGSVATSDQRQRPAARSAVPAAATLKATATGDGGLGLDLDNGTAQLGGEGVGQGVSRRGIVRRVGDFPCPGVA